MKKVFIVLMSTILLGGFTSCNDWLDVDADTRIGENVLFEDFQGMRTAMNGVYRMIASDALYGGELNYGLASVLGCEYEESKLPSNYRYMIFYYGEWYDYYQQRVTDPIWKQGFTTLANINNLLQAVEEKEDSFFEYGNMEKEIFMAELRGLRGMLHFDLLRLYAPAPIRDDGKKYLPYVEKYPDYQPVMLTVKDVMAKAEKDLMYAKETLAKYDTATTGDIPAPYSIYTPSCRFAGSTSVPQGEWFQKRGTRMNFYAAQGILMRLYMWSNDESKLDAIIDWYYNTINFKRWFKWNDYGWTTAAKLKPSGGKRNGIHRKMYEDIWFAAFNTRLNEMWEAKAKPSSSYIMRHTDAYKNSIFGEDLDDLRLNLFEDDKTSSRWVWAEATNSTEGTIRNSQMVLAPIIRASEMALIYSEALARKGRMTEAIEILYKLRVQRGAKKALDPAMSRAEYDRLLEMEYCKEFLSDGQKYYFYKRQNKPVYRGESLAAYDYGSILNGWVIPAPLEESSYVL